MKLLLIDGNNTAHRVHWTHRQLVRDGMPVSLLYGFFRTLISLKKRFPGHLPIIAWDGGYARRLKESEAAVADGIIPTAYKSNRHKMSDPDADIPPDVKCVHEQMPPLKEALKLARVMQVQVDGVEADDLIATYCKTNTDNNVIITSDHDYYQLIGDNTEIYDDMKTTHWNRKSFVESYGFDPAFWVDVGALMGDKCFVGSTKIKLLNGKSATMQELTETHSDKEFWVYSCDKNGDMKPGRAHSPRKTNISVPVVKVSMDNGESEICTPDHPWMLLDGTYKMASELRPGDSLMPLYTRTSERGYEEVFHPTSKRWKNTHSIVAKEKYPQERTACIERCKANRDKNGRAVIPIVHHKNLDKRDNEPTNLEYMTSTEHFEFHSSSNTERNLENWNDPEYREKMKDVCSKAGKIGGAVTWEKHGKEFMDRLANQSEEWRESSRQNLVAYNKSEDHILVAKRIIDAVHHDPKYADARHRAAVKRASRPEHKARVAKIGRATLLRLNGDDEQKKKQMVGKIKKIVLYAQERFSVVDKSTYEESRKIVCRNFPSWDHAVKIFGEGIMAVNHKVVSVEPAGFADVYNIEVDEYHNFALESGVFVHNSDEIHGVPGVGEVNATKLVKEYGCVENVLAGLKAKEKRGKKEQAVIDHEKRLQLARSLKKMDIIPGLPSPRVAPRQKEPLMMWFQQFQFNSLLRDTHYLV